MAKFFFDTQEGQSVDRDTTGVDLPDEAAARAEAQEALADMAREKLPNGNKVDFAVLVRDESGQEVYSATLKFEGHRPGH
jgi:hypothetical protein